jgi:hypothetical protein
MIAMRSAAYALADAPSAIAAATAVLKNRFFRDMAFLP